MSSEMMDLLRAVDFAARHHTGQVRKGDGAEPYVNHVIEVAYLLARATQGRDPVLLLAGALHDTVEDTDASHEDIEKEFGAEVAALVREVTDDKSLAKAERKRLQVLNAPKKSDRAKMIKLADKTSNLRSIVESPPKDWSFERKREYFEWAASVIAGCRGVNETLEGWFDLAYEKGRATLSE